MQKKKRKKKKFLNKLRKQRVKNNNSLNPVNIEEKYLNFYIVFLSSQHTHTLDNIMGTIRREGPYINRALYSAWRRHADPKG